MGADLTGKVVLITGAGRGIGAACAHEAAAAGAHVVVADLELEWAQEVAAAIRAAGGRASAAQLDVSDEASVQALVDSIVSEHGRLDGAVNNAGISAPYAPVGQMPSEHWHRVMDVNLHGVFYCLRAEIAAMQATGGSIVNVSSVMGLVAKQSSSPYITSKHAVMGLSKAAALDHAAEGIRVNAVAPGYVDTPLLSARRTAEQSAATAALHPRGQLATPEEISHLICWLLSDEASFCTGAVYVNDGGYIAH